MNPTIIGKATCVCGKRIFKSIKLAKFNGIKLKSIVNMFVYECHAAPRKGVFHITKSKGAASMKIEARKA